VVGIRNLHWLSQLVNWPERFEDVKERQRVGLLRGRTRRIGRFEYRLSLLAGIKAILLKLGQGSCNAMVCAAGQRVACRKLPDW
jgi:hypothetical protein